MRSGWNEVSSPILILQVTAIGEKFMRETAKYFTLLSFHAYIRYLPKKILSVKLASTNYKMSITYKVSTQVAVTNIVKLKYVASSLRKKNICISH